VCFAVRMSDILANAEPKNESPNFRLASTPLQAKLLSKRIYMMVLWSLRQPSSISEIAKALNESLETISYRIKRLERAEIVRAVPGTRKFTADFHWDVPGTLLPTASLQEFMTYFLRGGLERATAAFASHLSTSGPDWTMRMNFETGQSPVFQSNNQTPAWFPLLEQPILCLKPEDARELSTELHDLLERFVSRHDPATGEPHLLGILYARA
jgi:DNA-binding transcriptional ArsR family regulator